MNFHENGISRSVLVREFIKVLVRSIKLATIFNNF